ncbi:MAG: hypothetical protein FJ171_04505 [Gammaproteobacteria bacterium]|nr:hypothetical protein [Gammaproteobacteria bacterium]
MKMQSRRRLIHAMLAAPALSGLAPSLRVIAAEDPLIDSAAQALDVFDFERLARQAAARALGLPRDRRERRRDAACE